MSDAEPFFLSRPPLGNGEQKQRVMAIGKFDGLHIAHQMIMQKTLMHSQLSGGAPCLFSFTPHPRYVLSGDEAYARWLTPPWECARLARRYGAFESFVASFDDEFREQSAEQFVRDYLLPLGVRQIVVGYDFRFGKGGAYTAADLTAIAKKYGLGCEVVEHVDVSGSPVSSSRIRADLQTGDVISAARLLARPYQWRARVVHGDARGRTIGFPTANLQLTEAFVIPAEGVYAVDCITSDGELRRAMLNIGRRPTVVDEGQLSFEAHLLDFDGDLYDSEMVIEFIAYLRSERKFSSLAALREQLTHDADAARKAVALLRPGACVY